MAWGPGEATLTNFVYFELVLEDGMFQGKFALKGLTGKLQIQLAGLWQRI